MRADLAAVLILSCSACAIDLDPDDKGQAPPPTSPVEPLSGCLPLAGDIERLEGRLDSVALADERILLLTSTGPSGVFVTPSGECPAATSATPEPLLDLSSVGEELYARPLAALTTSETYLYFSAEEPGGFSSRGIGVARFDESSETFVEPVFLWTADRPSFGSAAVLEGDLVYVFGGLPARFLAADVYLARVPANRVSEPGAYEYWAGGGNFSPNVDQAAPLVEGGTSPSVAFDARHERWLLAYSTPLAREITVRTGLGVSGPWSAPVVLGACDLPEIDPDSFCADTVLHPSLAEPGEIALSHSVASFARPNAASSDDFWTRFVRVPWPEALP